MKKVLGKIISLTAVTALALAFTACSLNDDAVSDLELFYAANSGSALAVSNGGSGTGGSGTGGSGAAVTGTPITFDCTNTSSQIGTTLSGLEKKAAVSVGTYDGVTLTGTSLIRSNTDSLSLELGKAGSGTASFTVASGATVKVYVASTSSSNTSDYKITGAGISKIDTVTGSTFVTVTTTATSSGTVTVSSDGGSNSGRGTRLQKILVTYN